jgi:23S rRNA pseudouridine1911/1915/1917 synthase
MYGRLSPKEPALFLKGPERPTPLQTYLTDSLDGDSPWLIGFGAVYVNQKRVISGECVVSKDDIIRVHLRPKRYELNKAEIKNRIIAETADFIVVDKPSGLPMHPTLDNLRENLLYAFDSPVFVTHRLDVPTSGLVLVAKTKEFQRAFNKIIFERKLRKLYQATVVRPLPLGELLHYMEPSVKAPKVLSLEGKEGWFECRLKIWSLEKRGEFFEALIELFTGRTHQIRSQLAFVGSPIMGDEMYGGIAHRVFGLRACELSFRCPFSQEDRSFKLTK